MATDNVLAGLSNRLDNLASISAKASAALDTFVNTFDKVMTSLGRQMTQFVSLANPAVVIRFNMALQNAASAIGRVLIPVLEKFTGMIQQIGNAIESLSPQAKALVGALAAGSGLAGVLSALAIGASILVKTLGIWPTLIGAIVSVFAGAVMSMTQGKELTKAFGEVLKSVGSVIEVLAQIFVVVFVPVIKLVANVIKNVVDFIARAIKALAEFFGLQANFDPNAKIAQAVRQSQMTDIRGIANRAYTQTFGGAATVQERQLSEAEKQTQLLEQIRNKIGGSAQEGAFNYGRDVVSGIDLPKGKTAQEGSFNAGRGAVRRIRDFNRDLLDSMRRIFG